MPFTKDDANINKNGRPTKPLAIPDMLRSIADEIDPQLKQTNLELICRTAIEQAIDGDAHARNWIADRMEGKAKEFIEQRVFKDELIVE